MRGFNFRIRYIVFMTLVGLLSGCATFEEGLATQGYKRLNGTEIQSTFTGNTLIGRFVGSEYAIIVFFAADGTLRGMAEAPSGRSEKDKGHWKVSEDDMFCDQWENWQPGSDCDRIYLRGKEIVIVNTDGTKSSSGSVELGNSKGL